MKLFNFPTKITKSNNFVIKKKQSSGLYNLTFFYYTHHLLSSLFQEVFSVSVGNLPPKANVLIKITYVAELPFDGELINFVLPGCVAPWTKDAAMATKIQVYA